MAWRFERQLARRLPAPLQLLLKRGRSAWRGDDSASPIGRLRKREQAYIDETVRARAVLAGRRRFLMFAFQQTPPWVDVTYALAAALRLRGHDVRGVLCDGVLPLCEMNLGRIERPSCEVCVGWLSRHEAAFGEQFARLRELVTQAERAAAHALAQATPAQQLHGLVVDGVEVGRIARRELQRYHRGFVFEPEEDAAYRSWIVAAVIIVWMTGRLLERERPDVVVMSSGRTLPSACAFAVARARGIRVTTWDTEPTFADGLVFSHDAPAVLIPLDEAWPAASRQALDAVQRGELLRFLEQWARGAGTLHGCPAPLADPEDVRAHLRLRREAPLVVAFGNAAWDMAAVDRDVGFDSMFAWLFAVVEYAAGHPDIDVVVRAHPAEANAADDLRSRTPVDAEIRRRYDPLPPNVRLVEAASPVDSYALAELAGTVMVYSSRIGLEMALRGRRPWVAGATTYRGKGFTFDIESRAQMYEHLAEVGRADRLSPAEVERAERFAYLWFFRYIVRMPLLRQAARPFTLETFRVLAPGGHPALDRVCEAMETGAPCIDLGRTDAEAAVAAR